MLRTVRHRKFVRDLVPVVIRANGDRAQTHRLITAEFRKALLAKLIEKTREVAKAKGRRELIGELTDVQEVMTTLYAAYGVQCEGVTTAARKKRKERGGFTKRIFLESTMTP